MEISTQTIGNPPTCAQEMATTISWQKVLTFPRVEDVKLQIAKPEKGYERDTPDNELHDKLVEHGFKVDAKGTVVQSKDDSVEVE